jgi:hypothetical protein
MMVMVVTEMSQRHKQLARLWCNWNGQTGTAKQIERLRCTEEQLERMLGERGVQLGSNGEMVITRKGAF